MDEFDKKTGGEVKECVYILVWPHCVNLCSLEMEKGEQIETESRPTPIKAFRLFDFSSTWLLLGWRWRRKTDEGKGHTPRGSALRLALSLRLLSASASLHHILGESLFDPDTHTASLSCVSSVFASMATATWMDYSGCPPRQPRLLMNNCAAQRIVCVVDFIQGEKQNLQFQRPLSTLWISFF